MKEKALALPRKTRLEPDVIDRVVARELLLGLCRELFIFLATALHSRIGKIPSAV